MIGVTLSFLAVVLSIPLACSTWLGQRIHLGHGKGYMDRNIGRVGNLVDFVLEYPRALSVIGVLVTGFCFLTSLTFRPDDRQGDMLPRESEPAIAFEKLDRVDGGVWSRRNDRL